MDLFLLALIVGELLVIGVETALWFTFRAKAGPISYPHEADASSLRFFTFARLRILILAHTIAVALSLLFIFLMLW